MGDFDRVEKFVMILIGIIKSERVRKKLNFTEILIKIVFPIFLLSSIFNYFILVSENSF